MTNEQRAGWIRFGIIAGVTAVVLLAVWFFPDKEVPAVAADADSPEPRHLIEILVFHHPGQPECDELVAIFDRVQTKYGHQILVTRLDVREHAERAREEQVVKPPRVVMIANGLRVCRFHGLWTQGQIERKIDEILHGLQRMGKDWRPNVQGMQQTEIQHPAPATTSTIPQPATAATAAAPPPSAGSAVPGMRRANAPPAPPVAGTGTPESP